MSSAAVTCASQPALLDGFARWICVFPVAVKNFLRPAIQDNRAGETRRGKQRAELGSLLTDAEADELLNVGTNQPGGKSWQLAAQVIRSRGGSRVT